MLEIKYVKDYISIKKFEDIAINGFSVLTGLNGSGKTHFLKALDNGSAIVEGIDTSEILLYNYNDFIVANVDENNNGTLAHKYNSKRDQLIRRVGQARQQTLNSFKFVLSYNNTNLALPTQVFTDVHVVDSIGWSESEIIHYERYVANHQFDINSQPVTKTKIMGLMNTLGISEKVQDIRRLLAEVAVLVQRAPYILLISQFNYDTLNVEKFIEEYAEFQMLLTENPNLNFWDESIQRKFSPNFSGYMESLTHDTRLEVLIHEIYKKDGNLVDGFRQKVNEAIDMVKSFFKDNLEPDILDFIVSVNGEDDLLKPVQVESGFLNIKQIEAAEKEYQINKRRNIYNHFLNSTGEDVHYLRDEEFDASFGESPVQLLNEVLGEYDCNGYMFHHSTLPKEWGINISQQSVSVSLYNKRDGYTTSMDSLSSGERTLMALAFYIYKLNRSKLVAKLLLLDEIDTALHPSMSKRLLTVLHSVFYTKMKIKILMSTHSPSTVAFAPDESLVVVRNDAQRRFEKVNRDQALKELTVGVPSFSINYKNRRQVFVESKYDVEYYEKLYNIFSPRLNSEVSLNFISSGDSEVDKNGMGIANCDQVIKITSLLRSAGNQFIWGVIDWDLKNEPEENFIRVLGNGTRYSIENYIFDPLLLAILLWREQIVNSTYFDFDPNEKFFNASGFEKSKLQIMIDKVVLSVFPEQVDGEKSAYELVNGMTLELPTHYTTFHGHSLETTVLKAFPKLNSIKKDKESALKRCIIDKVVFDFPELSPKDLLSIFRDIQE